MLKLFPDHIKNKTICENAVKKLPFAIRHVTD